MFQRHEGAYLQALYVRQMTQHLAPGDFLPRAATATDDDPRKRGPDIRAPQLVIDLANTHLDDSRIADGEVAIRFRLFELEL